MNSTDEYKKLRDRIDILENQSMQLRLKLCQLAASHNHNTCLAFGKALLAMAADHIVIGAELDALHERCDEIANAERAER